MHVSVVIPVYQAVRHLESAIASSLLQKEVGEVILIDDRSTDGSLEVCARFAKQYADRVKLVVHPGHVNLGAGASRNLGIQHASCPYIAFLDADDIYTPDRFDTTLKCFAQHPDADGVYAMVGTMLEDYSLAKNITQRAGREIAGIRPVSPQELFSLLAKARDGYIHLNGLTLKRTSVSQELMFDPSLRQCQDTDFLLRWSAYKTLYGVDDPKPVALRRVHDQNRVFNEKEALYYRKLCMEKCAVHDFYGTKDNGAKKEILNRMARATRVVQWAKHMGLPVTPFRWISIGAFLLQKPKVISSLLR